ncbi:MAG: YkoF family thiamine/hydroxymethylpyrimidine-binding protein [bacterium]
MANALKGPGYMSAEIVGCQLSVYALRQPDIDGPVQAAIQAAGAEGCSVRVGNLSTLLSGSEDQVFQALRAAFRAAQRSGPTVMTATLAAGMPTDELVGEIQREVDVRAGASMTPISAAVGPPVVPGATAATEDVVTPPRDRSLRSGGRD